MNIESILESFKGQDKKTARYAVIAGAILVVDILFVASPQVMDLLSVSRQASLTSLQINSANAEMRKLDFYKKTLEESNKKFSWQKDRLLSHEGDIPDLLESIAAMARESGVKIISIKPIAARDRTKDAGSGPCRDIPILINAKAGYHELGVFASRVENAGKFMKIADIHITSNKASVRKHDIELLVSAFLLSNGG